MRFLGSKFRMTKMFLDDNSPETPLPNDFDLPLQQNDFDLELLNYRFTRRYEYLGMKTSENHLHIAVKSGNQETVAQTLAENPGLAVELNHDGYTPLHLACLSGNLDIVREIIQRDPDLCLVKDKNGRTALHTAAMEGRIDVTVELLSACPEMATEVSETNETALHVAIRRSCQELEKVLLEMIRGTPYFTHVINTKDCAGYTALHLAVSRKRPKTIKLLLGDSRTCEAKAEVNAMTAGGFTALDILDVLPRDGNIDMEIEKILRTSGALRARDLAKHKRPRKMNNALLVTATLLTAVSFLAILNLPGSRFDASYKYKPSTFLEFSIFKRSSYLFHSFIVLNSIAFITSIALVEMILINEHSLKPWTSIPVFSMICAYICSVIAVSHGDALPLLFLGSTPIFLAFVSKYLALRAKLCHLLQWLYNRIRGINVAKGRFHNLLLRFSYLIAVITGCA